MNQNRDTGPRASDEDRTLGTDLGAAIGRRSQSLERVPPVAGVVERAAMAASARRLRYTLVGVTAAAALLAGGLVARNTLSDDGDGAVRVATAPATSAAAPVSPGPDSSPAAGPQPPTLQPSDPLPAGTEQANASAGEAGLDGSEPSDRIPTEPADDPETDSAGCETLALADTMCECPCPKAPFDHFFKGRIAKDGYELRFGEPPGGMTLWDLTTEAPVHELEAEAFEGGPVPDGGRLTHNENGSVTVVFEHPETGEELVTVTTRRTSSTGLTFEGPFEGLPDLWFEDLPDLSTEELLEHLDKRIENLDDQLEDFNDWFEDFVPDVEWSAPGLGDLLERLREAPPDPRQPARPSQATSTSA
ncbi:MAG: hypothetical protein OXE75_03980 [bacterium]|nr:hypothetical protein [bacterium]